jgi:hypothetical protein
MRIVYNTPDLAPYCWKSSWFRGQGLEGLPNSPVHNIQNLNNSLVEIKHMLWKLWGSENVDSHVRRIPVIRRTLHADITPEPAIDHSHRYNCARTLFYSSYCSSLSAPCPWLWYGRLIYRHQFHHSDCWKECSEYWFFMVQHSMRSSCVYVVIILVDIYHEVTATN